MFREINTNEAVSTGQGGNRIQRYPDGSINFDLYRAAGRRERRAAILASIKAAAHLVRAIASRMGLVLTGKSGSPAAKQAHHAR